MKSLKPTGAPSLKPVRCSKAAIGLRVMLSAPTTSATLAAPLWICSPACRNSSKPVPQMRCTMMAGTSTGTPAYRPMWRGSMNCSKSPGAMLPAITESISPALTPERRSTARAALMPRSVGDTWPMAPQ